MSEARPNEPAAAASPPEASFPLDQKGQLLTDLPCLRCGYNLRGLSAEGACPECGTAVGRSLRGDLLRFADPAWVTEVASGLNYLVASLVVGLALVAVFLVATGVLGVDSIVLLEWLSLVPAALELLGYWKLTAPDPGRIETEAGPTARGVTRVSAVVSLALTLLGLGAAHISEIAGGAVDLVSQINEIVLTFAGLLWLRHLAMRVPDAALAKQTGVVMWGLAVSFAVMALAAIGAMLGASEVAGLAACPLVALLVFLIWWIVLIVRYRARLNEAATSARATWARGE